MTSQYKGVYWHSESGKWYVQIHMKNQKRKYGGIFEDELDAAKRMNQLCEEFGIPLRNPELSAVPNEQHEVPKNMFCHTALREKCEL